MYMSIHIFIALALVLSIYIMGKSMDFLGLKISFLLIIISVA